MLDGVFYECLMVSGGSIYTPEGLLNLIVHNKIGIIPHPDKVDIRIMNSSLLPG